MPRTLQIYFSQMKLSYLALLYRMDSSTLTLQVGPFSVENVGVGKRTYYYFFYFYIFIHFSFIHPPLFFSFLLFNPFSRLAPVSSMPWHFKCHMLELTFTSTVYSQILLGVGMHFLYL